MQNIFKPKIWLIFLVLVTAGRLPAQESSFPVEAITFKELPSSATDDPAWFQMIATCIARANVSTEERAKLIAEALMMVNRRSSPIVQPHVPAPRGEVLEANSVTSSWLVNPYAITAETPMATTTTSPIDLQKQLDELRQLRQTVQVLEQQLQTQTATPLQTQMATPFQLPSFQREIEADIRPVLASAQAPVIDRLSDASSVVATVPAKVSSQEQPPPNLLTPAPASPSGPLQPLLPKTYR